MILIRNSEMKNLSDKIEDQISGLEYAMEKAVPQSEEYLLVEKLLGHLNSSTELLDLIVENNGHVGRRG